MADPRRRLALAGLLVLAIVLPGAAAFQRLPETPAGDVAHATSPPAAAEPTPSPNPTATPALAGAAPTPRPLASPTTSTARARSAIVAGAVNRSSLRVEATYDVDVTLRYDTRLLAVNSIMRIVNRSGGGIDRLELNTIAARLGGLTLKAATVDGTPVTAVKEDQTLVVPLGGVLPDGARATVRVQFTSTLKADLGGSNWLFAKANGILNVYRWLPWISRKVALDRPNHGDPFVTPVSPRVQVEITTDRPMTIAATGERTAVSGLTQTWLATNVRDFTITASPSYATTSKTVGGDVSLVVYHRAGAPAAQMLAAAEKALTRMESMIGQYPFRTFRVAQSAGGYGMEGPGIIWIPTGVASSNLPYLVTHETAHQWFYGIVGADQAAEPFTDEAVTDFVARYALGQRRASRCTSAALDRTIYDYSDACYYEIVYIQGGNFLDDLRKQMGHTAFWTGLRAWVDANRNAIAPTKSLLHTLDAHTPLNLVPTFEPRFPRLYQATRPDDPPPAPAASAGTSSGGSAARHASRPRATR